MEQEAILLNKKAPWELKPGHCNAVTQKRPPGVLSSMSLKHTNIGHFNVQLCFPPRENQTFRDNAKTRHQANATAVDVVLAEQNWNDRGKLLKKEQQQQKQMTFKRTGPASGHPLEKKKIIKMSIFLTWCC